jgi:hypothetical protein
MAANPAIKNSNTEASLSDTLEMLTLKLAAEEARIKLIQAQTRESEANIRMYEMEIAMHRAETAAIKAGLVQNERGEWVMPVAQQIAENETVEELDAEVALVEDDGYYSDSGSFRPRSR